MTIIEFLVYIRKTNNLSVKKMSELIDIPARTIGSYERGERPFDAMSKYATALSAYFGISPIIFDLDDINKEDIKRHKLSKLSTALRRYMLWSGLNENETYALISKYDIRERFEVALILDIDFIEASLKLEKDTVNKLMEGNLSIEEIGNRYQGTNSDYFYVALAFLLSIGKFKPSSFVNNLENFFDRVDNLEPCYFLHYDGDNKAIRVKLETLERNGLELTKENVKMSMAQGVIIDDDRVKEMLNIIQSTEILRTSRALELLKLIQRHPSSLDSCLDKLKKLDEVLKEF